MFTVMRIIVGSKAIYSVLKKTDPRHCAIKLPNRFSCDLIASCCRGSVFSDTMYCRSISIVSQFMVSFCFILLMLTVRSWPVMCVVLDPWGQVLVLRPGLGFEAKSWSWVQALFLRPGLGLESRPWSWGQVLVLTPGLGLDTRPLSWGQALILTPGLSLDARPCSWGQVLWSWPWELHWQFLASPLNAGKTLKLIIVIVTN